MPTKRLLIAPLAVVALAAQAPETLTPDGPATLYGHWGGAYTLEGERPELLVGFRVVVGPGGRAGTIRLLVHEDDPFDRDDVAIVHAGPSVTLPAEPGTYTFPAPHVYADYRSLTYGVEQETGGHAITAQVRCDPEEGSSDICNHQSVDVYRPVLGATPPDRRTAADVLRGRELTLEPITESDVDRDGAGDQTEDRTNLRASATTRRLSGNRRAFDITVENAGPRTADRPRVAASLIPSPGLGTWAPGCREPQPQFYGGDRGQDDERRQYCLLAPLAVGERRTVRLVVPDLGVTDPYFGVTAEGRDLASGDEAPGVDVRGPRPPLTLEVPARVESIQRGVSVAVRSSRAGTVRLRLQRGKHSSTRTLTFRRPGRKELRLRPSRRTASAPGLVTITARLGDLRARARVQSSY